MDYVDFPAFIATLDANTTAVRSFFETLDMILIFKITFRNCLLCHARQPVSKAGTQYNDNIDR